MFMLDDLFETILTVNCRADTEQNDWLLCCCYLQCTHFFTAILLYYYVMANDKDLLTEFTA